MLSRLEGVRREKGRIQEAITMETLFNRTGNWILDVGNRDVSSQPFLYLQTSQTAAHQRGVMLSKDVAFSRGWSHGGGIP